ncbi:MAG: hypothetical protein ACOCZ6_03695 [Nanoarchaeota archaeon]
MKKKGWSDKELKNLEKILKQDTKRDYLMKKHLNNLHFWTNVLVILLLNFAGIFIISPVFLFMNSVWIHVFTGIFGLCLGAIINYLALSTSHLELKHHLITIFLVPVIVLADVFVFKDFIGFLSRTFNVVPELNSVSIVIVFMTGLLLPYLFSLKNRNYGQ